MAGITVIGVAFVVVIIILVAAADRWNVFTDEENADNSGTDRVKQPRLNEADFRIPLRRRHKKLTIGGKLVIFSMVMLAIGTVVYFYFTFKNGAPVEVPYARSMKIAGIATVAFGGGVGYRNMKSNRGELTIIYEDRDGEKAGEEKVYFNPNKTTTDDSGNEILYEMFPTRFLGLFPKRKLVGHDPELRGKTKLLSDQVTHQLPSHRTKISDTEFVIRTQGREAREGPNVVDYYYEPAVTMRFENYVRNREKLEKMEVRLDSKNAQLSELENEVTRLREKIRNDELSEKEDLLDFISRVGDIIGPRTQEVDVSQERGKKRHPQDQTDAGTAVGAADSGVEQ